MICYLTSFSLTFVYGPAFTIALIWKVISFAFLHLSAPRELDGDIGSLACLWSGRTMPHAWNHEGLCLRRSRDLLTFDVYGFVMWLRLTLMYHVLNRMADQAFIHRGEGIPGDRKERWYHLFCLWFESWANVYSKTECCRGTPQLFVCWCASCLQTGSLCRVLSNYGRWYIC